MNSSGSLIKAIGDKEVKLTLAKFALKHYHTALVTKGIVTYDDLEAKCVACVGDEPKEDADDVITDMVVSHTHRHMLNILPHLDCPMHLSCSIYQIPLPRVVPHTKACGGDGGCREYPHGCKLLAESQRAHQKSHRALPT
jgi:hypothetical protein